MFLIVATLFLLNALFIILLSLGAWAPLFTLMVLFNLLSSWSRNWALPITQVVIRLLQYLHLNFFITKVWKWTKETRLKCRQINCDSFTFYNMWLCDSFSECTVCFYHTLRLPEYRETPCSNQAKYVKLKWLQRDSNSRSS